MFRVVAYDQNGEFTFFDLKKAKCYCLAREGMSEVYDRDSASPGTGFVFDGILKTADSPPRWFLSGNVNSARWLGRTFSKPRRNGRDYLEVNPRYAAACFFKHRKRLPPELAAALNRTSEVIPSEDARAAATPEGEDNAVAPRGKAQRGALDQYATMELIRNPSLNFEQLARILGCSPRTLRDKRCCPLLRRAKAKNNAARNKLRRGGSSRNLS